MREEGPDPHPWAREIQASEELRRRSWQTEPWEDLHAEALVWRGMAIDFRRALESMDEESPGYATLKFGIEYADMRMGDILDAMERIERYARSGERFPWPRKVARTHATFHEMKARLNLPDVIEDLSGQTLERRGNHWVMCCPLPGHPDATPSFVVTPGKQVWFCHGCHRGGDVITFVQEQYQLVSAAAALRMLAQIYPLEGES
jgi:hypothetical protein